MSRLLETLIRTFLFEQAATYAPETKPRKRDKVAPADLERYLKIINTDRDELTSDDKTWWVSKEYRSQIGKRGTSEPTSVKAMPPRKQSVNKIFTNSSTAMDALNAYKLFNPSATPEAAGGFSVKINFKNDRDKLELTGQQLLLKLSSVLASSSAFGLVSSKAIGRHVYIVSNNIKDEQKQLYNVWLMDKAWIDAHNMDEIFKIAGTDVYDIGKSKMIQWSTIIGIIKSQPELNKFTTEEIAAFDKINNSESAKAAAIKDIENDAAQRKEDQENAEARKASDEIDQKPIVDPNTGKVEIVPKPAEELPKDNKVDPLNPPIVPGEEAKEKPKEQEPPAKKLTNGTIVKINKADGTLIDYYLWDGAKMVLKSKSWSVDSSDNIKYIKKSTVDASLSLIELIGKNNTKQRYYVKTALLKVK
jgi:hypothetical protein